MAVLAASAPSKVISGGNLRARAEACACCACLVVSAVQIGVSSGSIPSSLPQQSRKEACILHDSSSTGKSACATQNQALRCFSRDQSGVLRLQKRPLL